MDLYLSWRISSNFSHTKNQIRSKFSSAGYPLRFVNSVINDFPMRFSPKKRVILELFGKQRKSGSFSL